MERKEGKKRKDGRKGENSHKLWGSRQFIDLVADLLDCKFLNETFRYFEEHEGML